MRPRDLTAACLALVVLGSGELQAERQPGGPAGVTMRERVPGSVERLPDPDRQGTRALEALLQTRLSVRGFAADTLSPGLLGQLLWAAGGLTRQTDFAHRTIPSAGALYPLEFYVVTAGGAAHYDPAEHALTWIVAGDLRGELARAALGQDWMASAPVIVVIAAEPQRTARKYGERAERYVWIEAGCACQNLLLEATALGVGATPVGAFHDDRMAALLGLPPGQRPLLLVPLGWPRHDG